MNARCFFRKLIDLDKEGFGGPNPNGMNSQSAWGGPLTPNINAQEIGKEFDSFIQETSQMLNEQIDEAMDFNPTSTAARKGLMF